MKELEKEVNDVIGLDLRKIWDPRSVQLQQSVVIAPGGSQNIVMTVMLYT